ncbi:MAG: aspartate aminotransferase family protein [Betaproteobacteria bacterium]|nr:aspartate aminotransferase family protein [Betaproteobacteria bacterium]MDH5285138.1 aspartate aminotransferase family protein [Betaproteobacteria bacterium]
MAAEGDVNLSPRRKAWQAAHVGPNARAMLARDGAAFLHQSLSTPCLDALAEAEGIWLTDADGRRTMDFHGNNVHQVGYRHPRVLAAVQEALGTLPFSPRRFANRYATELAERLGELAPDPLGKVLFAPGGTLAIGMALKLARVATGRHKTVSLWDSFHGASLDAISIGGEAVFRKGMGPLLPGAEHAPPPDPRDCRFGCGGTCNLRCAEYVAYMLDKEEDVAAVIVETVRCTDVQIPPPDYYRILRDACDRHGSLLILDEVPIALGRTGRMFAFEHYGVVPDMVVLGKGLGGAVFPLAALIARRDLDVAADRALGHYTHEKSSVGCAAGLATLDVIAGEGLCERSRRLGERALDRMRELKARHALVRDVRGLGLLLGIELARADGTPARAEADAAMYECLARGLSFKVGQGNVLALSPPLVIAERDLDAAFGILDEALTAVAAGAPP